MPDTSRARPEKHQPWLDAKARPYIHIDAVTKQFGEFRAVDRTTLEIYQGELFCLLGASGCGKTTLLRMLAGFEYPTSGRILIDGQDMTGVPAYDRPVNMMFQNYALFPHMSVEQNVAYGLKQDGVRNPELKQRVGEALGMVQLGPWAKRKPHQLSGGQRQRVALARALVKRPKVLLLDEPLAALDRKLRESTQFELMNLQDELGVTFVVVTHDQEEAMTLSTRMAVMDRGRLVQVGTPNEIYEFPATRFTADFIGSINLIEGRVKRLDAGSVLVAAPQLGCDLTVSGAGELREGQNVCVALRPEKIVIEPDSGALDTGAAGTETAAENTLRGSVRDVAYLGDSSVFRVDVGEGVLIEVMQPNMLRSLERKVDWDDAVVLTWRADAGLILTD